MELGWQLEADEVYDGDLILWDDTLDLNGHTLTVNGDVVVMGGELFVNGGKLVANKDLRIQTRDTDASGTSTYSVSSGSLVMTNESDEVIVAGDFYINTKTANTGKLTEGTLTVGGNFTQIGSNAYLGSGNNKIVFNGNEKQIYSTATNSSFGQFVNENGVELCLNSSFVVSGLIKDSTNKITGAGQAIVTNLNNIENGVFGGT